MPKACANKRAVAKALLGPQVPHIALVAACAFVYTGTGKPIRSKTVDVRLEWGPISQQQISTAAQVAHIAKHIIRSG